MADRTSAGILLFRLGTGAPEVLAGHMGGPYWARRDERAWSIPKGEHGPGEDPVAAARREFEEEIGSPVPAATLIELGSVRQPGGKLLTVWAVEGDLDATSAVSTTFEMEWPPGSGARRRFPEIDRAAWFDLETARVKLVGGQVPFLERLRGRLDEARRPPPPAPPYR